jgi:anti-sigma B factor antagonist
MTFAVSTTPDGASLLAIEGELDSTSSRELRDELEALVTRGPSRVVVDLARLHTIDSAGVGTLVSLFKRVRAQGGSLTITGLQDQPLAIFRLLKLHQMFTSG